MYNFRKLHIALALFLPLFGFVDKVKSQNKDFKERLQVGASFGTNFSSISFYPYIVDQSMLMAYSGGITARWITEKNLGLQAELNLTQYGWDETFDDNKFSYSRRLNYVELPILTHIYFGEGRASVFINAGPKMGYLLYETENDGLQGESPNRTNEQHDMPTELRFDWGVVGGLGTEIKTGIGSFQVEGRYYFALSNIYNARKEDYFSRSSSRVISAKITYLFSIF